MGTENIVTPVRHSPVAVSLQNGVAEDDPPVQKKPSAQLNEEKNDEFS